MKTIKNTLIVLLCVCYASFSHAQTTAAEQSPESKRISIAVVLPSAMPVNDNDADILFNRLTQSIALNGLSSLSHSAKFVMVPSITVLSKEVTTQVPQQFVVELELTLFLVDMSNKNILQQSSMTLKGIGPTETKAVNKAITTLQARSPQLKKFIVQGKEKIVAYYEDQCEILMKSIQSFIDRKMFFEAYFELIAVPHLNNNVGCYEQSLLLLQQIEEAQQQEAQNKMNNEKSDVDWVENNTETTTPDAPSHQQ
ncbi:MAG: hypothetical protein PHR53_07595 [Bacteroidales bacterium]|nr:hypothetical protein [Bacteroidales bacterium]